MTGKRPCDELGRFPRGWFVVGFSEDLEPEQVRPARYFDRDFVIWRTSSGQARVFDAHCPHLGAHLGHGGKVEGDSIRCPFHSWGFDATGQCTDIPYASRVPPKARVRSWPTLERNGMVMMWFDALQTGYFQDVAMWEHKKWQDKPLLCDGDGPIGDLRRWYAQFYETQAL
jgi:phenylpropionate dioxygenase-like ring-hydroxylating dioxygenase large terminal subunit